MGIREGVAVFIHHLQTMLSVLRQRRADRKALSRFTQDGISERRRYEQARCK